MGSNHIFSEHSKFGLQMYIGCGATASQTEAMYFPPQRQAYAAADTSRFLVDGSRFVELSELQIFVLDRPLLCHLGCRRLQAHQIG